MKNLHKSVKFIIFALWVLFCFYGLSRIYHAFLPKWWDIAAWFLTMPPLIYYGTLKILGDDPKTT